MAHPQGTAVARCTIGHRVDAAARPAVPAMFLTLLGGWRLTRDGHDVHLPVRCQRLTALLALRGRQARALVAGTLWPEVDEHRAQCSLRATLWAFQRREPGLVAATTAEVWLLDHVSIDVQDFLAHARPLVDQRPPQPPEAWLRELPSNGGFAGELLPGWSDDWVVVERERMRQLHLHALEALTYRLLKHGEHAQALEVALTAVDIEPLRESAHRAVMRVHLAEGNITEALSQYAHFRALLKRTVGMTPSQHMTDLLATTRTG